MNTRPFLISRLKEEWNNLDPVDPLRGLLSDAIDALTEQPAQQQEPVAWMWRCKPYCGWPEWSVSLKRPADSGRDGHKRTEGYEDVPLYTSPPASKPWVGLTGEEMKAVHRNAGVTYLVPADYDRHLFTHMTDVLLMKISSAIEAKLREKNA